MKLESLLQEANDEELRTIAHVVARVAARPAVVVTVKAKTARRYVIATEDEHLFADLSGTLRQESRLGACDSEIDERFGHMGAVLTAFGCQWLRRMGVVDEMYRTLSMGEVTKVERIDRKRVWGR